jgi:hypothetical protein
VLIPAEANRRKEEFSIGTAPFSEREICPKTPFSDLGFLIRGYPPQRSPGTKQKIPLDFS